MSFQGECFLRIFLFICNIPLMDSVFSVMLLCILDVPIKLPVRACDYALFFFFFFFFLLPCNNFSDIVPLLFTA